MKCYWCKKDLIINYHICNRDCCLDCEDKHLKWHEENGDKDCGL